MIGRQGDIEGKIGLAKHACSGLVAEGCSERANPNVGGLSTARM